MLQGFQGKGAAAVYLQGVNAMIIRAAAERRQSHWQEGARSPAGLAAAPVELVQLTEATGAGVERVTPLGYRTARRQLPRVLGALAATDRRRITAELIANSVERLGSVKGSGFEGSVTKGEVSDGGASTRMKHAARLRLVEALANGWPVAKGTGKITRGRDRVVFQVQRQARNRQEIKAFPLLYAVCVEGRDLQDVLDAHGWSKQTKHTKALGAAVLEMLDQIAERLGR